MPPIIDLHCDLLHYLAGKEGRSAYDEQSRCSIPQLLQGGVKTQVFAIYEKTQKGSVDSGARQAAIYASLRKKHKDIFPSSIIPRWSCENASIFCEEKESFPLLWQRVEKYAKELGKPLYISLTWNEENRFGGGAQSKVGLKEEGKKLLQWMAEKNVSIDFSHASDWLIEDILQWIDKEKAAIVPIASHSNFRYIVPELRNLPDDFAKEIAKRGGVIGLNFVRRFMSPKATWEGVLEHIDHAITMHIMDCVVLGADFFYEKDFPHLEEYSPMFMPQMENAAHYPHLIEFLHKHLTDFQIESLSYKNAERFLQKHPF